MVKEKAFEVERAEFFVNFIGSNVDSLINHIYPTKL